MLVSAAGAEPVVLARCENEGATFQDLVQNVARRVANAVADGVAIVDAPADVPGAQALGTAIAQRLRDGGMRVSSAPAVSAALQQAGPPPAPGADVALAHDRRRDGAGRAGLLWCGALAAAVLCAGIAFTDGNRGGEPTTVLVEGRVGMQIPTGWSVRRVTTGRGSARVEVVSASDPDTVVHLTQTALGPGQAEATIDTLRQAFDEQPPGVFTEFDPADRIADRPVVSYLELRAEHHIRWAVFVDGSVRIAVGCQSSAGEPEAVRYACDCAIRSAHAVPPKNDGTE